jgi:OFA family oxalate/formate antiporter-like MFS transporter
LAHLFIHGTCGIAVNPAASSMEQETAGMSAVQTAIMAGLTGLLKGAGRIARAFFRGITMNIFTKEG